MSLLPNNTNGELNEIARRVFDKHFELDPKLNLEYNDRRKMLMYEDILHNLSYLKEAMRFEEDKIFEDYAIWIYHLMCHLMKDLSRERIKDQMILHYRIVMDAYAELFPEDSRKAINPINKAIEATENQCINFDISNRFYSGNYLDIKKKYLALLLQNDTKAAVAFIDEISKTGISIHDIYTEIMQEVMYEVGNLWHQNIITVDKEHYCTATTQVVLSQFYPLIFGTPRNGFKLLSCCVGSELHEMGVRMLSDLFEYNGWDSIYLGASMPTSGVIHAIGENHPDLIALSVTMPRHLPLCLDLVNAIREKYGDVKIAVGGRAFQSTNQLWKKWPVDVSTENAVELIEWADKNIVNRGGDNS